MKEVRGNDMAEDHFLTEMKMGKDGNVNEMLVNAKTEADAHFLTEMKMGKDGRVG